MQLGLLIVAAIFFFGKHFSVRAVFIAGILLGCWGYREHQSFEDFCLMAVISLGYILCDIAGNLREIAEKSKSDSES